MAARWPASNRTQSYSCWLIRARRRPRRTVAWQRPFSSRTPPAGALADTAVLAPRLDGVLLVISAGHTKRDLARRARQQLERVNANLLGVVLIDVREDDKRYKY